MENAMNEVRTANEVRDFEDDLGYMLSKVNRKAKYTFPLTFDKGLRDVSIAELKLSQRAVNVLGRNKIDSLGLLMDKIERLNLLRNCGETTSKEIKNAFLQYWYNYIDEEDVSKFWENFMITNFS